jgi:adenylosuccinate synthase
VPVARYSARVNGLGSLALTKLDVLDELESVSVCVGYRSARGETDSIASSIREYGDVEPVFETFDGWMQSTRGISRLEELPAAARSYVEALSGFVGVEIGLISTGPERDETILVPGGKVSEWAER